MNAVKEGVIRVIAFVAMEVLHYFSYLIRVPVVFLSVFIGLIAFLPLLGNRASLIDFLGTTIYRFYLLLTMHNIQDVLHPPQADYHTTLQGPQLWRFMVQTYAFFSTAAYIVGLPFRYLWSGRPKMTYRVKFAIFAGASALSWTLAVRFLAFSEPKPGQSPWGFVILFIALYILTLAAYAVALALYKLADLWVEFGNTCVQGLRRVAAGRTSSSELDCTPRV